MRSTPPRFVRPSCSALLALLLACGGGGTSSTETDVPDGSSGSSGDSGSSNGSSGGGTSSSGSSGSSGNAPSVYSTEVKEGIATYYAATGGGHCMFDPSPHDLDVVALNDPEYAVSAACGACMKVTGPKGSVTVRVVDSCPGCEEHHLDLSKEAFAKIAEVSAGRVDIRYQTVACEVSGKMQYLYKEGSSKYWTAIQIRNHKLPIAKLEYKKANDWVVVERLDYNYFVVQKGVGDQPSGLRVRITAADGQVREDVLPGTITPDQLITGTVQFD